MNEIMEALEQSELIIQTSKTRSRRIWFAIRFEILLTKEVSKQTNLCSRS